MKEIFRKEATVSIIPDKKNPKYVHIRTQVPKTIAEAMGLEDKDKLIWIFKGNIVEVRKEVKGDED